MPRSLARVLPALTVLVLLLVALLAPSRKVSASRSEPDVDYLYYPSCTYVTEGGIGYTAPYDIAPGEGITQPIGGAGNIATAILSQSPSAGSGALCDVVFWDPLTLMPAAGQVMIRSRSYDATYVSQDFSRQDFFPPVITRALANVAEPPPMQVAIEQRNVPYSGEAQTLSLVADDATTQPSALRIHGDGTRTVEPGPHPVFSFQLCGGDQALQDMRVVQCVMKADTTLDPNVAEYIQRFRIPASATVRWIEFAFGVGSWTGPGRVQVFDATGQETPPFAFSNPILDAQIYLSSVPAPGEWGSHVDLASFPTLQANHEYWLVVNPIGRHLYFSKALHGDEGGVFTSYIGPLYRRDFDYTPAAEIPDRALTFRIIGTPTGTVGVDAPAPAAAGFALRVSPNPARGATSIAWSGARGAVALEVIDPRGRRVASVTSAAGRWSWNGSGADGRALPAGVYFVRARDAAGHAASARVTLVR